MSLFTVNDVVIQMFANDVSVTEDAASGTVCAQIGALPADGLQTGLTVTLSTTDGSKAGL